MLFGLVGVYEVLFDKAGLLGYAALVLGLLAVVSVVLMYIISKKQKPIEDPKICKPQL